MSILGVNGILAGMYQYANRTQKTGTNRTRFTEQLQKTGEMGASKVDAYTEYLKQKYGAGVLNLNPDARGELDDAGSPVYFKKITVTPDDERAWFKTHSQWSKSNKYAELEVRIYI